MKINKTLLLVAAISASAMLIIYGLIAAICVCLIALYVREHMLRTTTEMLIKEVSFHLESEHERSERLENMLATSAVISGLQNSSIGRSLH